MNIKKTGQKILPSLSWQVSGAITIQCLVANEKCRQSRLEITMTTVNTLEKNKISHLYDLVCLCRNAD